MDRYECVSSRPGGHVWQCWAQHSDRSRVYHARLRSKPRLYDYRAVLASVPGGILQHRQSPELRSPVAKCQRSRFWLNYVCRASAPESVRFETALLNSSPQRMGRIGGAEL